MAVVTIELTPDSMAAIRRHAERADAVPAAMSAAMQTACVAGAEDIRMRLVTGELGLTMQNPGSGLAASLTGWMLDDAAPLGAVGVPSNSPAAAYAGIHERGGVITPRSARALAIPLTAEARRYSSPRDMRDLVLIKSPGRNPILARVVGQTVEPQWVLVPSVTIPARHWLSRGGEAAQGEMAQAFESRLMEVLA
jgi:hypothetical protein